VTPGNACAVAVERRIYERPVIAPCGLGLSSLFGQQIFDAISMFIRQCVSFSHTNSHAPWSLVFKFEGTLIDDSP
jgi:hypothetical protein